VALRSSARRAAIALACACSVSLTAPRLFAQTEAQQFNRALQHYDKREYAQAIEIWQRLLTELGPARGHRIMLNLARAYRAQGDATHTAQYLAEFIRVHDALSPQERAPTEGARNDAEAQLAALKAQYGILQIDPPKTGIVLVRVGMEAPQPAGFSVYLKPGQHEIELYARTTQAERRTVTLRAGETTTVSVEEPRPPDAEPARPPPQTEPPPIPFPTESASSSSRRTVLLVGGIATIVTAGVSGVLYLRASGLRGDASDIDRRDPRYAAAAHDYESGRTLFYASLALPAVAIAGTAIALLTVPKEADRSPPRVGIAVAPTAGGGFLSATRAF
jgi:hypothetical protein